MVFTRTLVSDLMRDEATHDAELRLVDIDGERLATSAKMVARILEEAKSQGQVTAHADRRQALAGIDFVINTIQVGGLAASRIDFEVPERYGIRQTIADTLGIGGISRALRTVPEVLGIAADVDDLAPDAVFLNYTNPMSMLVMALAARSRVATFGLCHSIPNTASQLASYLGIDGSRFCWRAAGINHMAWYLQLEQDGQDLYPRLFERSCDPVVAPRDPVRFELMRQFGYFMTESSEHEAEYLSYFLKYEDEVERLQIPVREYLHRLDRMEKEYRALLLQLERKETIAAPSGSEYAPPLIAALVAGRDWGFYANVMNRGLVENLPQEACVEVPCLVHDGNVQPIPVGRLPAGPAALNRLCIAVQELTVQGILEGDRDLVYQAALLDPQVAANVRLRDVRRLVDELIEAHADRMPALQSHRLSLGEKPREEM